MLLLTQLRSRIEKALDRMQELRGALVTDEEIRDFTDEEQKEYDGLKRDVSKAKVQIEQIQEEEEARSLISRIDDEPVRKAPETRIVAGHGHNEDKKTGEYRGFSSMGEQLLAIGEASRSGSTKRDKRLDELHANVRAATGMGSEVGADGGFAIQSDFAEMLFDKSRDEGQIASRCHVAESSSNSDTMEFWQCDETSRASGSRWGGVSAGWVGQGGSPTASKPKLTRARLPLEKLAALAYVTDEQLEDSSLLNTMVVPAFLSEMAWQLDDAIINGDGAGKPYGILNHASLVTVAKETSQTAATVVYGNVRKMKNTLPKRLRKGAIWLHSAAVENQLEVMQFPGDSSPIYLPSGNHISNDDNDLLYKKPVLECESCAALGTVGDIIIGNFSQYLLYRKGGVRMSQSAHVKFVEGEMAFKWILRVNGMPLWKSSVTEADGSTLRSPFAVVATRA